MMLITVITACKKKDFLKPVQKPPVKGQLFSYGTNTPISGAIINSSKCKERDILIYCLNWDSETTSSATDGSFSVQRDYVDNLDIERLGYWIYIKNEFNNSLYGGNVTPNGSIQYINNNGVLEKIIVQLFAEVKINVHIKNTSAMKDSTPVYFIDEALLANSIPAFPVSLRKGIDTTFEYTAFGNINNRFTVKTGNYDYYYFGVDSTLYSKDVFTAVGSNTSIDINF